MAETGLFNSDDIAKSGIGEVHSVYAVSRTVIDRFDCEQFYRGSLCWRFFVTMLEDEVDYGKVLFCSVLDC